MTILFSRLLAWGAAVAILPACWAVTRAFVRTVPGAFFHPSGSGGGWVLVPEGWALAGGVAVYALWHRLRPPGFLYTFVHEITHLLFGLLFGKKVNRLVVSRESGQVAMSGTNFLITLAPYFFPFFAAIFLAAGAVAGWGAGNDRFQPLVSFLTGLALSFHVIMTFQILATCQPDNDRGGRLFSWSVIYLMGALFSGGAALAAAGGGELGPFWGEFIMEIRAVYASVGKVILEWIRIGIAWTANG